MTQKLVVILALTALIALGVTIFLYLWRAPMAHRCDLCAEEIHQGTEYTIIRTNGDKVKACCPSCGLWFQKANPEKVRAAQATDYDSGKIIDAERAYYVEGSDVVHCAPQRVRRDETGGIYTMDWHRCNPCLIAFDLREAAEAFRAVHSGRVVSYAEAQQAVGVHPEH
jgi:nitrous oxide reductase accessory protein NosL